LSQFVIAAILAVAAAAPSSYKTKEDEYKEIVIVSQSDERNLDGSSQWRYSSAF
jgi:hypothetical protein